jgi:type I restriction enzyme S subunit
MEVQLKEELNLDKSDWTLVKFGDVVAEVRESTNDAAGEGLAHIVGLEHIDAENIHLRRSAGIDESTTFTKKFGVGDLLFGRRRAYLKKAAQAPFAGICSGDITVMRVKGKGLLPELLPFVVNNDKFFDYAVKHSAGGLSPRVKFKDLANYEFLLPPKDQQAQLAELLWAMDEVVEREREVFSKAESLRRSLHKKDFSNYRKSPLRIGTFSRKVGSGVTPKGGSKVYLDEGIRFIRSQNVLFGEFDFDDIAFISESINERMKSSQVQMNDVLLNITGASIGRSSVYSYEEQANVNQHVCIIRCKKDLDPDFLSEFLNSSYGQNQIQVLQAGGNREGLNFASIKLMRIPLYNYKEQLNLMRSYHLLIESIQNTKSKIFISRTLQKSLINQIF